jgi:hypothetical protein
MKSIFIIAVFICFSNFLNAQDLHQNQPNNNSLRYDQPNQEVAFFKVGFGYWMPKGNLSNYIDNSPLFELALVVPDSKRKRSFELGIQLGVPQQNDFFILTDGVNEFEIEATSIVNGYLKLNKYVYEKPNSKLTLGISLGIASIFLDPVESDGASVLDYGSVNSVLVAPGLIYDYMFNDESMLQFSIDIQYTPFKLERAVTKDISSFTLLPKVSYRF